MSRRHRDSGLLNPVLIGALTVLITIVAVVLAFQANNGLPFVPRYTLYVHVANAEELTRGGEVHMGGALVGSIASVSPARTAAGRPIAVLDVQLNKNVEPLPIDSRFTIRLKAAIGEKYLAVTRGSSRLRWRNGATVPLSQTAATVDLDQMLSMFTPLTRVGVAASTVGFSNALAGRGGDLNDAIGAFAPLTRDLGPVMRNLASQDTDLAGFIDGLGSFTGALAPVAQTQASLYSQLDTTFGSLARVAVPYLQDWISQTPPTFSTVINSAPRLEVFARDTAALFSDLRPVVATLSSSAPVLAQAFAAGVRNLPATSVTDQLAVSLAHALAAYSAKAAVQQGLARLTLTASSLDSPLSFLTPVQSTCNYVTLFLRNIASALSDNVGNGTVLRLVIIAIDQITGSEAVPSQSPFLSTAPGGGNNHGPLHANPYPNTAAPGQTRECAAGNERYSPYQPLIGNPPGNVGVQTEKTTRSGG
jgi:virulence factor Mce-like protein